MLRVWLSIVLLGNRTMLVTGGLAQLRRCDHRCVNAVFTASGLKN